MEDYAFSLTNSPSGLERVQREIQAILQVSGLRPSVISPINLALGEWIENIIQHAYADGGSHPISVDCKVGPAEIVLRVADDGRPFNPCDYPEMNAAEASKQGAFTGRGIHLIRHLMDRVEYERQGCNNILVLSKNIT